MVYWGLVLMRLEMNLYANRLSPPGLARRGVPRTMGVGVGVVGGVVVVVVVVACS